jgi:FAD/FMN-containing dehydrogenase
VGGGVPTSGEVIMSLLRLDLVDTSNVDRGRLTVGAGVALSAVQTIATKFGWEFGVDLAARDSATIGGMIATNAGGVKVVRYGQMRSQVLNMTVVMADGSTLTSGGRSLKDNAGFDLNQLIVGSEGTLGIVTEAELKLVRPMNERVAFIVAVGELAVGVELVRRLQHESGSLDSAELFDDASMSAVCDVNHLERPTRQSPWYVLIECADDVDPLAGAATIVRSMDLDDDTTIAVATDAQSRRNLWRFREQITESIARMGIPHKLDVGIPLMKLDEFSRRVRTATKECDPPATAFLFGHLGEGNVHVNILGVSADNADIDEIVLAIVVELGGNVAAEHGIGRAKSSWLGMSRSPAEIHAMRQIKRALDPNGILNPGCLFSD